MTVTLYWSEYFHGKWQPARTSDVNRPNPLGEFSLSESDAFDRAKLTLRSSEGGSGELIISVAYPRKTGTYYKLYNTHSLPIRQEDDVVEPGRLLYWWPTRGRSFNSPNAPFTITYSYPLGPIDSWSFGRKVLGQGTLYQIVQPRHTVAGIFEAPFFFQDPRHVFFVHSEESKVWVGGYPDFGMWIPPQVELVEPPVLVQPDFPRPPEETAFAPDLIEPGVVDPSALESFQRRNPHIHQAMGTVGTIRFGDRLIGPGVSMTFDKNIR